MNTTAQTGTDFVGIKITASEREITFPMGYRLTNENLVMQKIEKELRKEILNLIKSIHLCASNKKGVRESCINGENKSDFPIRAMLFIIEDFLDRNSYYTEKETQYVKSAMGKISWNRTIKNIKPVISTTGIAFLDFIVRKNRIQENQLITELHKYCVYKCFEVFGFLYVQSLPEKGLLSESDVSKNRRYYAQFLQDKIDSIHLESNLELFSNMLDFINSFDCESEIKNASYGTHAFQVVWEKLVDSAFGTVTQSQKEEYFYPHSKWSFKKHRNAPLRPDTIMILGENENKKCYIIDSKYYSYAAFQKDESDDELDSTEEEPFTVHGSIPGTDSIQKQITYAQYIDDSVENKNPHHGEFRFAPENIYNVFILPENLEEEKLRYIGYAVSEWHDNSKNYHTVHAVTLDPKFLMENSGKLNSALQNKLKDVIKKNYRNADF